MEVKINKLPKSEVEILVDIPWSEFELYIDKARAEFGKGVKVKGFRPGKAPQEFIEKGIDRDKVLTQAAETAVKEKYSQVVAERALEPLGTPRAEVLKLASGNPFSFRVKIEVLPKVTLPDYKEIASSVEKKAVSVTDEEAENSLKWLQKSKAKFEPLTREAKKGDFVEIEYQSPGIENNRVFKDAFLLGEGRLAPGFEQNLEGMRAGKEKEFDVTFPKDYGPKGLAGKKVSFKVKMEKVQLMKLSELNDGFAEGLGQFKDLEALKKSIREGITKEKGMTEVKRWREEVLEKMAQAAGFEVPQSLVLLEQERLFQDLKKGVEKELKMEFQDYLTKHQKKEENIRQDFFKLAQKRVKNLLILRTIGREEKVEVEDKEIEESVNNFLTAYPQENPQNVDMDKLKEYYKGIIYNEKVLAKLESSAQ